MPDEHNTQTGDEDSHKGAITRTAYGFLSLSLSTQIFTGLLTGVALGLFFGEMISWMKIIGDAFIRLLQMTVLPYVMVALMAGLGSLKRQEATFIFSRGGALMLVSWLLAIILVLVTPMAFPERASASFFSTTLLGSGPAIDFLNLYIPSNPFYSLANNLVPAVVLFSIAVGVALIGIKDKAGFLDNLHVLSNALSTVTKYIVKLTPLGVLAIAASAAGTMSLEDLTELQVYLISYMSMCLLATVWIFPALIAAITPFSYQEILNVTKDAMVTAFATGNVFVVLPMLADSSKELFQKHNIHDDQVESTVDVIIPVAYNFPTAGKLMMLVFVLFSGWFTGVNIPLAEYPGLALSGLVTFFGSTAIAMPYLFDAFHIPADMFQLFTLTGIINFRFSPMLASMSIVYLAVCGAASMTGLLKLSVPKLVRFGAVTVVLIAVTVFGSRLYLNTFAKVAYTKDEIIGSMHLMQSRVDAKVYRDGDAIPALPDVTGTRMESILDRGYLRVGYPKDMLPFAFFNSHDDLVGLDVQMMQYLADELGVTLEFVPADLPTIHRELNQNKYDIVIGGLLGTTERLHTMTMTQPYLQATLGFVTRDWQRDEFTDLPTLQERDDITIAVAGNPYLASRLRIFLPKAEIKVIERGEDFFSQSDDEYDAFLATAEAGSAWTLLHPHYAVAVLGPDVIKVPLAYAVKAGDVEFAQTISRWIDTKRSVGQIDLAYGYWILGKNAEVKGPRWSVIRDVLGWVE